MNEMTNEVEWMLRFRADEEAALGICKNATSFKRHGKRLIL